MASLVVSRPRPLTREPAKAPVDLPPALIPVTSAGRRVVPLESDTNKQKKMKKMARKWPEIGLVRIFTGLGALHQFTILSSAGSRDSGVSPLLWNPPVWDA